MHATTYGPLGSQGSIEDFGGVAVDRATSAVIKVVEDHRRRGDNQSVSDRGRRAEFRM